MDWLHWTLIGISIFLFIDGIIKRYTMSYQTLEIVKELKEELKEWRRSRQWVR